MTEPEGVTVADTVRWLHAEGLSRLVGIGERALHPIVAYTIDIATGAISAHPDTGAAMGTEVMTLAADDLPRSVGTPKRLLVVGVTTADSVLVVDLGHFRRIGLTADNPVAPARAWAMQLVLNPDITLTTNSADLAISGSARCTQSFIPGSGAMVINVDDKNPPVTTISLNPGTDEIDHLDVAADGTAELYLGARFWRLRQVMSIDDDAWQILAAVLCPDSAVDSEPVAAERFSESGQ